MTLMRVMTFNVNGSWADPERPERSWANRAALAVRAIQRYSPDLLGLQEVEAANFAYLREHLTDYGYELGLEYDEGPYAANSSIFWKAERFKLIESGKFWFSQTPDVRSSDWGVPYPMGATWVRLQDGPTGPQLLHLNTHFEDGAEGEQSRVESSKLIVARARQLAADLPVIATGDFNCNPWSEAYRLLMAAGFTDSYRAAGQADSVESSTFHGFSGREYFSLEWGDELFWRVDWILTRDGRQRLQTTSSTIVRDAEPPIYPSDHYPVVSELALL
ncbi:MAG: endonuclease/exonuclease/phosphatase family protein [Chloroflexota bacterium]